MNTEQQYHFGYLLFQELEHCNNINHSKLPGNKSGNCKPCEEFENGVSPKPLKGLSAKVILFNISSYSTIILLMSITQKLIRNFKFPL